MKNFKSKNRKFYLRYRIILLSLIIICAFASCEIQEDYKYIPSEKNKTEGLTTLEFLEQNEIFSLLKQAINITRTSDYFIDGTNLTFIAPTNQAFEKYLRSNNYTQLTDVPAPILRNILLYHIVNDKVSFDDPNLSQSNNILEYVTKNGQAMYLSHDNNYLGIINDGTNKKWTIITSNIPTKNGVVHVLNDIAYYSAKIDNASQPEISFTTDTIFTIHDSFVNGGSLSSVNYGKDPLIKVKNVDGVGDYDRLTYLMFDLADFSTVGNLREAFVEVDVNFTHGLGIELYLFEVPNNDWNENTITWNNAPNRGNEVARLISSKVSTFKWDIAEYLKDKLLNPTKLSFLIDAKAGSNETDDLISKENPLNKPPKITAVFSPGTSNLAFGKNDGLVLSKGEIGIVTALSLEMTGAKASDIIYKIEKAPSHGWLISGADILKENNIFTQQDIDAKNIIYINDGGDSKSDNLTLSVSDPDGGIIEPFNFNITIQ